MNHLYFGEREIQFQSNLSKGHKMKSLTFRAALLAAAALLVGAAHAQPALKMMIPANPGGGWDQAGRNLAAAMHSAKLVSGVQFENKGGAAGAIGLAQFVASAKSDPNAVMMGGITMVGGTILSGTPPLASQVTPIARLTFDWEVIVVPANSPHKTMADLVKAFKDNPGKVSWGGGSAGGTDHILVGLIAKAVGADPAKVNYVAFKGGGESVAAIVGGHVTAGVSGLSEYAEQIKAGKMRGLAVSSPAGSDGIKSLKEQGINVELGNWRGIFGAPGISPAQRDTLVKIVKAATETPVWKAAVEKNDWVPAFLAGDDYRKFIDEETTRVREILTSLGVKKS
jgi:putative tricarboxylic transport membrane protein